MNAQRTAKVIPLRPRAGAQISAPEHSSPFDQLTARLVLAKFRAGTLDENLFVALLAAATGLRP
jgi:hypothetical protein